VRLIGRQGQPNLGALKLIITIYQTPDQKHRLSRFEYFHNGHRPFDPAAPDGLIALFITHINLSHVAKGRNE
jgi:hypothetical protein